MKREILFMIVILLLMNLNFSYAETEEKDTISVEKVPDVAANSSVVVRLRLFTDENLSAFAIPLEFYQPGNQAITCDSVHFSDWFWSNPPFMYAGSSSSSYVDSLNFKVNVWATWFAPSSLVPKDTILAELHFSTGGAWDSTVSVLIDSFYQKIGDKTIRIILADTTIFPKPQEEPFVFQKGVLGSLVHIRGTVTAEGVSLYRQVEQISDTTFWVYLCTCGFDTSLIDSTQTDSSGNYKFIVGKGGNYCIYTDPNGINADSSNAYCFMGLSSDTSGINFIGFSELEEHFQGEVSKPGKFSLFQNYPNPFNPITAIQYGLPEDCSVRITVYNVLGRKIKTLADEFQVAGLWEVIWDGTDDKGKEVASGIYFYRLVTGEFTDTKKMLILR